MPTEENEPLRPPLQQPPASTPRKMKFLQVMADHTGDKLRKRASQNRAQTSVPLRDWSTKTPKRDKSANQNEKEEPPESAEKKKKKKTSRYKPFPRKSLWSWSMDKRDLVNDVTTLEDNVMIKKPKDSSRKSGGRTGSIMNSVRKSLRTSR
ncbi:hypothetical protein TrCOL_g8755 [Triparma columacea]|uniref:Uncharacterized protein n=1 Tax=Triparma columacea TaxID=722753 RepID=A0A9W7G100_9STRA|nr:hypothetical protein TrCOL_g8755 [Triparma columacea]